MTPLALPPSFLLGDSEQGRLVMRGGEGSVLLLVLQLLQEHGILNLTEKVRNPSYKIPTYKNSICYNPKVSLAIYFNILNGNVSLNVPVLVQAQGTRSTES